MHTRYIYSHKHINGHKWEKKIFFSKKLLLNIHTIYAKFDWYGGLHRLQLLGLLFPSLYFYNMFIIYSGFYNIFSEPWLYSKPSFLCLEKVYAIFRLDSRETVMSDREYFLSSNKRVRNLFLFPFYGSLNY